MPAAANRRVVALVYDRLCTFEFGIVVEIFGLPIDGLARVLEWAQRRLSVVRRMFSKTTSPDLLASCGER